MKEHLKSFVITFLVAFAVYLTPELGNITLASVENGALYAVLFGAVRAGVKGILELFISKYSS